MSEEFIRLMVVSVTLALVIFGVAAYTGNLAHDRVNKFAADCNARGGVARHIDGVLNCVKEVKP